VYPETIPILQAMLPSVDSAYENLFRSRLRPSTSISFNIDLPVGCDWREK